MPLNYTTKRYMKRALATSAAGGNLRRLITEAAHHSSRKAKDLQKVAAEKGDQLRIARRRLSELEEHRSELELTTVRPAQFFGWNAAYDAEHFAIACALYLRQLVPLEREAEESMAAAQRAYNLILTAFERERRRSDVLHHIGRAVANVRTNETTSCDEMRHNVSDSINTAH